MGGTALRHKGIDAVRLELPAYQAFVDVFLPRLKALCFSLGLQTPLLVPHLRSKASFGDLDVIIDRDLLSAAAHADVAGELGAIAHHNMGGNDPVISLAVPTAQGPFQVDLISVQPEHRDYARNFLAWGDAGSFVSNIGRQMGLRHGQMGLHHFFGHTHDRLTVPVCNDHHAALSFMGLDPVRFAQGFDHIEDVFEWIGSSAYFDPGIYQLPFLTCEARKRVQRRPNYLAFLEWMEGRPATYHWGQRNARLAEWQPRIFDTFPHVREKVAAQIARHENRAERSAFSSAFVSDISGVRGDDLQHLMNAVRKSFGPEVKDILPTLSRDQLAMAVRKTLLTDWMPVR